MSNKILITGAAGFIGSSLARHLISCGHTVVGVDNYNDYYDPALKRARVKDIFLDDGESAFIAHDLTDKTFVMNLFKVHGFSAVVHLAAQAGVRYSIENPDAYLSSNLVVFLNMLEACRAYPVEHFLYASSSSVYGGNKTVPFSTDAHVNCPISFYAATKAANELMAHSYSHLYGIASTGLRFFTVYGPWGRPDMAIFIFTKAILEGKPIKLFNQGQHRRDFTYVDDVVAAVTQLIGMPPKRGNTQSSTGAPWRILNVGRGESVELMKMVHFLEQKIGQQGTYCFEPMQKGDVYENLADVEPLYQLIGMRPEIDIEKGLGLFLDWYRTYYGVKKT